MTLLGPQENMSIPDAPYLEENMQRPNKFVLKQIQNKEGFFQKYRKADTWRRVLLRQYNQSMA